MVPNKRLDIALELLRGDTRSPLKQVEALHVFEKSLDAMYLHKYQLCADSFIEVRMNSFPFPFISTSSTLGNV